MIHYLLPLYERDLDRLQRELEAYGDNPNLWESPEGIHNSAGNLTLHLLGNLQHFIGHVLGETDYVRNRKFEFEGKDVPVGHLLAEIDTTKGLIRNTLQGLRPEQLDEVYPLEVFGAPMQTGYFLIHLQGHLNYHLGQINYLRRLTTG